MAWPVTDAVKRAFLGSHEMTLQVKVLRGTSDLGFIPVIDANVSATYGTQGGRDASLVVSKQVVRDGFLDPNSDQVVIYTGIPGVAMVPLFTGRVDEVSENSEGDVGVQLLSRAAEAIRAEFEIPWAAGPAGTFAAAEMTKIIQSIDPTWGVDTSDANNSVIPGSLVWEQDPGQALDQLGQGASLIWQPDRVGSFRIYVNPWTIGSVLGETSVVTLVDGQDGVLVSVEKNTSRVNVYNSVTVVTERVNNTMPVRVTARDMNPASPTYWGGPFGKQNLVVKNQTPDSVFEAENLARRLLRQSLALQRSFRISIPDMPLLDPGDVFTLWYENVVYAVVAESLDYSTRADSVTSISGRELRIDVDVELS